MMFVPQELIVRLILPYQIVNFRQYVHSTRDSGSPSTEHTPAASFHAHMTSFAEEAQGTSGYCGFFDYWKEVSNEPTVMLVRADTECSGSQEGQWHVLSSILSKTSTSNRGEHHRDSLKIGFTNNYKQEREQYIEQPFYEESLGIVSSFEACKTAAHDDVGLTEAIPYRLEDDHIWERNARFYREYVRARFAVA